ncbi:hypothetical protein F2E10_08905 [Salmonella enterica]|nr:hypothetical protein [Salmonella enterica]ECR8575610.1 hypothetical protein [Salmonella enterica]EDY4489477.1 hypothetical protein [Salmonella enterica]EJM7201907.1 Lar family restriction alleviation protein [Salmonella enterica]EJO1532280.1 Lar family restriction alleviation protein [Salmonella enterica]
MTTNHPAHDPVSLVRLHQISEILSKAAAQSDGGNLGYAMADAVKVIDGAIAAFGAKLDENGLLPCPLCGGGAEFDYDDDNLNWISCSACGISTDTVYHTDIDARDKLREVWNRRTAMLQGGNHTEQHLDMVDHSGDTNENGSDDTFIDEGTKPAGNSPVVPDGWQLVPKEPTEAMNKAGWAAINEHDAINPTYRAMLAAAPQQEVK